jgi:sulfhydrogenase subunit beta (sulfur reductase)
MKILTQEKLNDWLSNLALETNVVAPIHSKDKLVYGKIDTADQIAWGFERTHLSPKNWYFPKTEPILFIEQRKETKISEPPDPEKTILFGIRPCDARSLLAFDALFLDKQPADRQYKRHREALTLIGISCPQMWDTCFCTAVGGAPNSQEGLDILLTEVDEGYAVEILSDKGEQVFSNISFAEKEITLADPLTHDGLPTLRKTEEWMGLFNDLYWEKLSNSCISCRTCSFVCPTCRCYDVRDELVAIKPGLKEFTRLRAWDACTATGYRRIAGGHNPRESQEKRLRNRFYCKFMYYPDDFGPLGCVGCGRCIDACPVGIDILEVITKVDRLLLKNEKVSA